MLNRSPGVHSAGCWLSLLHLIRIFSGPQTPSGFPRAPLGRLWLSLPHLVHLYLQLYWNCNWDSNSTEIYNSSMPTRSLKSHVWSSSSGSNCHAVHRPLSSGASLCSGAVGPSPCPILSALIRPRDLFRLLAIGMCHFLPVHHLGMAFLGRVEGQNITLPLCRQYNQRILNEGQSYSFRNVKYKLSQFGFVWVYQLYHRNFRFPVVISLWYEKLTNANLC